MQTKSSPDRFNHGTPAQPRAWEDLRWYGSRLRRESGLSSWVVLSLGLGMLPHSLLGLGLRIPNQDAQAVGRGNAFVATADNPSAIYYNPAGILQSEGHEVQVGLLGYLGAQVEYTSPAGRTVKSDYALIPVPEIQYTFAKPESKWGVGLGVYTPFGLKIDWPDDTGFRTLAKQGELMYLTINPVFAYEIASGLSVAVGPTFNYSSLELQQGLAPVPPGTFDFDGDGWSTGFNFGVQWKPHEKWAFGASYRYGPTTRYEGSSQFVGLLPGTDSQADLEYPMIVIGGVSFRPTPRWNIEFNVDWTGWNSVESLVLEGTALGDIALPLNWESSFFYEFGATYSFPSGYYVSAGYYFSESSTPDEYFTPLVPDPDIHVGSVGVGYRGEHWRWAVSGQIFVSNDREVSGSLPGAPPFFESADGTYSLVTPAVSASVGYHF